VGRDIGEGRGEDEPGGGDLGWEVGGGDGDDVRFEGYERGGDEEGYPALCLRGLRR
jgi:hypothetical protein